MSKMDDLRAMREARYEQSRARAKAPVAADRPERAPILAVVPDPPEADAAPRPTPPGPTPPRPAAATAT